MISDKLGARMRRTRRAAAGMAALALLCVAAGVLSGCIVYVPYSPPPPHYYHYWR
jgi:hypothetical protein